jgi:hypothetical protein
MKKRSDWVMLILIFIFSIVIFGLFYKSINKQNKLVSNSIPLADSFSFFNFQKAYLTQLIYMANWENNRLQDFNSIKVYDHTDEKKQSPIFLTTLLKKTKPNIVIRYTEIGCNSCADSTFKFIRMHKKLIRQCNILVLVDFSNYDAYLKWIKVSEIPFTVFWLKKGDLPFKIESENSSFIFTVNSLAEVNNFFVPNSRFSEYIANYFYSLESKL